MSHKVLECDEVITRLFAYLDGEIADTERADIDRHLERCRDCFTRAEFERQLKARLAETRSADAPARLRDRVKALIARF